MRSERGDRKLEVDVCGFCGCGVQRRLVSGDLMCGTSGILVQWVEFVVLGLVCVES